MTEDPQEHESLDDLDPLPMDHPEARPEGERPKRRRRRAEEPASMGKLLLHLALITVMLGMGFLAMLGLLESRPQFAGWGLAPQARVHEQAAPSLALRTVGRPTHEVRWAELDEAHLDLELSALQDWRGLQVTRYLQGELSSRMSYQNRTDRDEYLAWKLPLPKAKPTAFEAADAQLTVEGLEEEDIFTTKDAWVVMGTLRAGATFDVTLEHPVTPLSHLQWHGNEGAGKQSASLRVDGEGVPIELLGAAPGEQQDRTSEHVWNTRSAKNTGLGFRMRRGYSVFDALERLLQIAPIVAGMFLVTLLSLFAAHRAPRPGELLLIALAYAYYFPLVVYLNANMPMKWAIPIAFVASAAVVLNYLRFLIGGRLGIVLGLGLLLAFQLVPTMMAFAQWDRGLVLLSLGSISLLALVRLQTRRLKQSLGEGTVALAALLPLPLQDSEIRVSLPAELVPAPAATVEKAERPAPPGDLLFGIARYDLQWFPDSITVEAVLPVESTGKAVHPDQVMGPGVYLESIETPPFLRAGVSGSGLKLFLLEAGTGEVLVRYRVPVEHAGGDSKALVPTFTQTVGLATLKGERSGLEFPDAPVWSREVQADGIAWTLGAGTDPIAVEWRTLSSLTTLDEEAPNTGTEPIGETEEEEPDAVLPDLPIETVHEIAALESHHLTLVESDGRVLHFAEYVLDADATPEDCRIFLPRGFGVTSVALDGREIEGLLVDASGVRFPFTRAGREQTERRVTLALSHSPVDLGFRGTLDLGLPRYDGTEAEVHWELRAPEGFEMAARGTGMQPFTGTTEPRFGRYSIGDKGRETVRLTQRLLPEGPTTVRFAYVQRLFVQDLPLPR